MEGLCSYFDIIPRFKNQSSKPSKLLNDMKKSSKNVTIGQQLVHEMFQKQYYRLSYALQYLYSVVMQYIQVSFYKMNGGQVLNEFWVNFFKQGKAITALIGKLIGVISDVASVFMHRHQVIEKQLKAGGALFVECPFITKGLAPPLPHVA